MLKVLLVFLCLFVFAITAHAAVIINEISPRTSPEWVELYNTDNNPIDLAGWYLVDKAGNKKDISALGSISSLSYLVFTGIDNWLNNSGEESLALYAPSIPDALDSVNFNTTNDGTTIARIPTITGAWFTNQTPTEGTANFAPSPSPSPSPSLSPSPTAVAQTPTPSPSPSPTPSPVPSPTPTPTPTHTPSHTPKPSLPSQLVPSPSPDLDPSPEGTIAGVTSDVDLSAFGIASPTPTLSPSPANSGLTLRTDRLKTLLMIGGGLTLISIASFFGYRKYLASRTISS